MNATLSDSAKGPIVRVGVSTCLLGENVRVNGGHCRSRFLTDALAEHVDFISVCPEVEMGMGIPRPPLRLVRDERKPGEDVPPARLVYSESGEAVEPQMRSWARQRLPGLADAALHGFVLKKDSPTCGVFRVRVYDHNGSPSKTGRGVWADELARRFPYLPMEEEGRLNDPHLRENFILRIFTYARWRHAIRDRDQTARVVRFHAQHKFIVMAHSPVAQRELGRLVAEAGSLPWDELVARYETLLMTTLQEHASRGRHVNVLQHFAGFFKDRTTAEDKRELASTLAEYARGTLPLVVPLTLVRHHLRTKCEHEWAREQVYLDPYPSDLMLRNVV